MGEEEEEGITEENVKSESETVGEVKSFWDAMHQRPQPSTFPGPEKPSTHNTFDPPSFDELSEPVVVKVWGQVYETDHNHLFSRPSTSVPLSALHPPHVHIFRLWQVYSDNVSPLLRVTHAPTLQARILDAAGDVARIGRELEALMFGVYCAAVMSLGEEECRGVFGEEKTGLLSRYQDACLRALVACGFLRSRERDCLTAFFLYLVGCCAGLPMWRLIWTRFLSGLTRIRIRCRQCSRLRSASRIA